MEQLERTGDDRRAKSQQRNHSLLESRQRTLKLLSQLAEKSPFIEAPRPSVVRHFCQTLIDYTASGHFQLYHYTAQGNERRKPLQQLAADLYPAVMLTTDHILNFNDRFSDGCSDSELSEFEQQLNELAEILASRVDIEDRILDAYARDRRQAQTA